MNTSELTIQGQTFQAPMPYAAGHVLTEVEASVLNQTFLENLRNNFGAKIKKAKEENLAVPTADDFAKYAAEYKFGVRAVGTPRESDPIKAEASKLARAKITEALKKKGHKVKDLPEGKLDQMVAEALQRFPNFLAEAAKIVEARRSAVTGLGDLDLTN